MDYIKFIVSNKKEESNSIQRVNRSVHSLSNEEKMSTNWISDKNIIHHEQGVLYKYPQSI